MCVCASVCACVCMYVCMYVRMYVCLHLWMDGWMDGCKYAFVDGWMDGWMAGWAGGWVDEWMHVLMHAHKGICVHVHVFVRMHTCMQLMEIKRIENENDNHGDEEGSGHNEVMLFAPTMMFLITPMTMVDGEDDDDDNEDDGDMHTHIDTYLLTCIP